MGQGLISLLQEFLENVLHLFLGHVTHLALQLYKDLLLQLVLRHIWLPLSFNFPI